jgi:phosphoribosylaminoimidazole-succinocarboxamide synthase
MTDQTLETAETILANVLTDVSVPELPNHTSGKVRDSYDLPDGRRVMIASDRQSAFDIVLAAVPHKGQVLTQTANFWFEETAEICANHIIDMPDPNVVIGKRLDMFSVEIVVRDYMTGSTETSIWPMYQRGERVMYGITFPEGLRKNQKLSNTILTPTTKGMAGEHDETTTPAEIIETGRLTQAQWDELAALSLAIFVKGREIAAANGLILVDTKYEFGIDPDTGQITLADEIHTPDSSRYWLMESYDSRFVNGREPESLDKEFLRLWITSQCDPYKDPVPNIPADTLLEFSSKYVRLFEQVTGRTFAHAPMDRPVIERIRENLAKALPEFF